MTHAISYPWCSFALLAAIGVTVSVAAPKPVAAADGNRASSDVMSGGLVFPYEGSLAIDGDPMVGQVTLRFSLWDHPTDSEQENLRYVETQEDVELYDGRYFVGLGTGTQSTGSIDSVFLDGDRLFLGIEIRDGTGAFIPLQGRQAVESVPFAAWTAHAADMSVADDVTVGGNLVAPSSSVLGATMNIGGTLSGAAVASTSGGITSAQGITAQAGVNAGRDIIVGGNVMGGAPGNVSGASVTATGPMRAGSLFLTGRLNADTLEAWRNVEIGFLAIRSAINNSVEISNAQRLHISFSEDATDPGFEISGEDLEVPDGEITTDGDLIAESNAHGSCDWNNVWTLRVHATSDSDNNQQTCGQGRFAAGIDFTHRSGEDGVHQEYYRLYCCEL